MDAKRLRTVKHGTHIEHVYRPGAANGVLENVPDAPYADDQHPVKKENPGRVVMERYIVHDTPDEELVDKTFDQAKTLSTPPPAGSDEAAELAECTRPGRMLMLLMDENGRNDKLPIVTIGGRAFHGTVSLVAVLHDQATGFECWTDVTPADVEAVGSRMRAREEEAEQQLREAVAAGHVVVGWP
jgi:hypothetical protein